MKTTIFLFISFLMCEGLFAQQIPPFSLYEFNHYTINPAATGTTDNLPLAISYRKLWAGIDGSPSVQFISGHMEVADNMGAGAKIFNYQAGPLRKTGIELTYSYHIALNQKGTKLSFGLSGLLYQFYLNKSDLDVEDNTDEAFLGKDKMIVPDASFGVYLYDKKYFVGLSIPQLFQKNIDLKSDRVIQQKQVRHYYLHGGYVFEINSDWTLEPSLLFKFVEAGLFQADINTSVTYKKMALFSLSYRSSDAVVFQLGYLNPKFQIGYSFDLPISDLGSLSYGSHEIILKYFIPNFLR